MWIGAPSGENESCLLQGHQSQTRAFDLLLRFSGLYFSAPASEVEGRTVRAIFPPGSEPEGVESNTSDDSGLVSPDSKRQGTGRPRADVQPVHPWLDQLL